MSQPWAHRPAGESRDARIRRDRPQRHGSRTGASACFRPVHGSRDVRRARDGRTRTRRIRKRHARARQRRGPRRTQPRRTDAEPTVGSPDSRSDALRRIAAEVSGHEDVGRLFETVIDAAFTLFGVEWAGLWTYDDGPKALHLAAQRGLSPELLGAIADLPRGASTAGMTAVRERHVTVLDGDLRRHDPGPADDLPAGRDPHGVLRADRLPRARTRPPGPLSPDGLPVVDRGDRAGPGVRGPHRDRHAERPAGRIDPDPGRPACGRSPTWPAA